MNSESQFYALDPLDVYPEPVGTRVEGGPGHG